MGAAAAKSLQLCLTLCDPMDVTHQAPLSMGFSKQEYWSGLPCPPPGGLPDPGIKLASHVSCIGRWVLYQASLVAQRVKKPPAMQETWVQSLCWEDPLEKGKATHASILAWRIPWTVLSMGLQTVTHD